jgi:putative tricarboxylic transport membrane protein
MSRSGLTSAAKGELVFTSFLFLAGIVVLTDTALLQETGTLSYVSPKIFAFAVGIMLTVLPLIQVFQIFRGNLGTPEGIEGGQLSKTVNWFSLGLAIASLVFYVVFIELFGFIIVAGVLFMGLAYALGAKRILRIAIIAFSVSIVVFFSFTELLQVPLPFGFDFLTGNSSIDQEW